MKSRCGKRRRRACKTVSPPTPESNTPIGWRREFRVVISFHLCIVGQTIGFCRLSTPRPCGTDDRFLSSVNSAALWDRRSVLVVCQLRGLVGQTIGSCRLSTPRPRGTDDRFLSSVNSAALWDRRSVLVVCQLRGLVGQTIGSCRLSFRGRTWGSGPVTDYGKTGILLPALNCVTLPSMALAASDRTMLLPCGTLVGTRKSTV